MYSRQCYLWSKNCLQIFKPEHVNVKNTMLLLLMTVIVNLFALLLVKHILLECCLSKNQIFFKQATLSIFSSQPSSYILIAEEVVPQFNPSECWRRGTLQIFVEVCNWVPGTLTLCTLYQTMFSCNIICKPILLFKTMHQKTPLPSSLTINKKDL